MKKDLSNLEQKPISAFSNFDSLKNYSLVNAPIASKNLTYPIIIFSPGFWGSPARLYTSLCEDLASQGYIVFALNYPYITSPVIFNDGRVIQPTKKFEQLKSDKEKKDQATLDEMETWVADIRFVIDSLNKLNSNDAHFFGKLDITYYWRLWACTWWCRSHYYKSG